MRFIFPILPIILLHFVTGIYFLLAKLKLARFQAVFAATLLLLNFNHNKEKIEIFIKKDTNEAYTKEMISLYNFIKKNVAENEIIGFFNPRVLALFSDRRSIQYPLEENKPTELNYIITYKSHKVDGFENIYIDDTFSIKKKLK
jgi:hypothetical protein